MENQVVVFQLENEYYGVDITSVESIIKVQAITKVPHSPTFVEGLTNLRGKVLPVIDLRKRFGLPLQEAGKDSRIVVVAEGETEIGMVVDNVSEVLTLQDADIEAVPFMVASVDSAFITGIARLEGRLIILLDLTEVVSTREKSALQSLQAINA